MVEVVIAVVVSRLGLMWWQWCRNSSCCGFDGRSSCGGVEVGGDVDSGCGGDRAY